MAQTQPADIDSVLPEDVDWEPFPSLPLGLEYLDPADDPRTR
jgi:hypothetical protein